MTAKQKLAVQKLMVRFKEEILANQKFKPYLDDKKAVVRVMKRSVLKRNPEALKYAISLL